MNKVKTLFSITDFENLSKIKAHTIRIWEKRYGLFSPNRSGNNNREYTIDDLKKILNIAFLNNYGYKISRIAALSEDEINLLIRNIYSQKNSANYSINVLKLAMFNFDTALFYQNYDELIKDHSFEDIVTNVYLPLLKEIGLLWQTLALKPVHEHFISGLITQKLIENTSLLQKNITFQEKDFVFVLFLPENEVHEITILYINYLLQSKGYKTIYLGASVPIEDLKELQLFYETIYYVSHFTVAPTTEYINTYINCFEDIFLQNKSKLFVSGAQSFYITPKRKQVIVANGIEAIINEIKREKLFFV